ncbi:MAG: hypothetical protein A4S16_10140 [Proteobacteria bacterium SG_bin6]|nr:MAG: hypothetical protein A4S16_10140 [Proteobacteria bacterium SG_bin6]
MTTDTVFPVRLALGAAPLAGLYAGVDEETAFATLTAAHAAGILHIDTAPLYGSGLSESRIGGWLARHPSARCTLSTKVGRTLTPATGQPASHFIGGDRYGTRFDYAEPAILRGFEESCARLGRDTIDTLLLHDIGAMTHGSGADAVFAQALTEALPTMARLKAEGRVGRIGLGVNEWQVAMQLLDRFPIDVILLAGRYTLMDRSGLALLDRALAAGVEVWAAGIFNSGLLAGGDMFDYAPASATLLARRDSLRTLCAAFGVPITAAAIQFAARHPAVTMTLVGARDAGEVAAAVTSAATKIPEALWARLNEGIA